MNKKDNTLYWWALVLALLGVVTLLHYATCSGHADSHTIYRRLYYLPIILAAFIGGVRGGLVAAALATVLYVPHAFLLEHLRDPGPTVDKVLEIVHYLAIGGLIGTLVTRERLARERETAIAVSKVSALTNTRRLEGLVHLSRGLAHEIRNPLGGIQGAIEILADEFPQNHPKREMVDVALKETSRLNDVLSEFLDFARPSKPDRRPFDAADLVNHVAALLRPAAEQAEVQLVAQAKEPVWAYGDPQHVTQILVNLVHNAIAVTPPSGAVEVRAEPTAEGSALVYFRVADTGPGIPDELAQTIYDPYFSGRDGGTGLGLGLSALLVQQNGGILAHENALQGGAVFHFTLPAHAEAAAAPGEVSDEQG